MNKHRHLILNHIASGKADQLSRLQVNLISRAA